MDVKPTGETIARALREPRGYAIAIAVLASLATSLLIGLAIAWQNARAREAQVEQFGRATVKQLASLSVEPLIALDKIHLGVLVTRLADLDAVRLAAVLTLDDRVVATAGTESLEGAHEFTEPIGIEGEIAGYARVVVEDDAIGRSFSPGFAVWLMVALAGLMAGFVANYSHIYLFEPRPVEPIDEADEATAEAALQFLTVVNFFNQNRINATQRAEVLRHARDRLERVASATRNRLLDLPGTGWILQSQAKASDGDAGFDAFCAALAAAELLDELNADATHNPGIELVFRFGLHTSEVLASMDDIRKSDALQDALVLSAVAPDGSVAASAEAFERLLRPERLIVDELSNAVLQSLSTDRRDGCVIVSTIADAYRPVLDRLLDQLHGVQAGTTSRPSTF